MDPIGYLRTFLTSGYTKIDAKSLDKVFRFKLIAYVSASLLMICGFWHLFENRFESSFVFLGCFLLILADYMIFPPQKKFETGSLVLLVILGLCSIYLYSSGGAVPNAWIFVLLFPFISIYLSGSPSGSVISVILMVILIILKFFFSSNGDGENDSLLLTISFFFCYSLFVFFMYCVFETHKMRLEEEAAIARKTALELEKKNEFISGLSHRLRTSLSNIMIANNLIYNSSLSQDQKDLVETLQVSTNNLVEAVNKIVDISEPDYIRIKENITSFNILQTLDSITQIYSSRSDLDFAIEADPVLHHNLIGDPVKIKQIFLNLIQNIIVPAPASLVQKITAVVTPDSETKTDINISFNFETCFQKSGNIHPLNQEYFPILSHPPADLTNISRLIEHSGGHLLISEKGILTHYRFILNYQKDTDRKTELVTEKPSAGGARPVKLANASVLLVEDNLMNQKIVSLSLRSIVKNVDMANNGKEALDMLKTTKYDIILMDVQMPVMDGMIAAKKIRESEAGTNTRIPIIAITANALSGDRENCLAVGMNDYISKPYQIDILIQKMKALLE